MEGGREEVMMICRERASVEEGKEGRDVASGGGIELGREGGKPQGR